MNKNHNRIVKLFYCTYQQNRKLIIMTQQIKKAELLSLCKWWFYHETKTKIKTIIINSTCSLLSCMYRVGAPNAKLSTQTKFGPAKSRMTPSSLHIPMWPIQGKNHDSTGRGVHTMQRGNRLLARSICFDSAPLPSIIKLCSSLDPIAYNEKTMINFPYRHHIWC